MRNLYIDSEKDNDSDFPKKRKVSVLKLSILCFLFALFFQGNTGFAQTSDMVSAAKDGFELTKWVSDTLPNSGVGFFYQITFSIPAGATKVTISDVIPPSLVFDNSSYTMQLTSSPHTALTATESFSGGTYSLSGILPVASTSEVNGSISIFVHFAVGKTCNGTGARNRAKIEYTFNNVANSFYTEYVSSVAKSTNTWKIKKTVLNAVNQGGPCPNSLFDSVIKYSVCVYKGVGTEGQMNLVNGVVTDVLPTGAQLVNTNPLNCFTQSGNVLTWNIPNQIVASHNNVCCTFEVYYPTALFLLGSTVSNKAVLNAGLGDPKIPCASMRDSSEVCSELIGYVSGNITKTVATNSQPGCAGTYTIKVCNTGTVPIYDVSVYDMLPQYVTFTSLVTTNLPAGWSASGTNMITLSSGSQAFAPGACVSFSIKFTIDANAPAGTNIENCAYMTASPAISDTACCSFTVKEAKPIPCIWKEVCNPKTCYRPGDTLTYRLRIQNIGGKEISGAKITDIIDSNLVYIGETSAYTASIYNAPCNAQSDVWGTAGLNPTYFASSRKLTFDIPLIPFDCDAYGTCGQNGTTTVPFYFIQFKVRVSDSSAIGSVNNQFKITGGTLLTDTTKSNVKSVLICGDPSYGIDKEVRQTGTTNWLTSTTIPVGGSVDYRLRLSIPATSPRKPALRRVSFIDYLPMDNNTTDQKLKPCVPRGSQFGLSYTSIPFLSSTLPTIAIPVNCSVGVNPGPALPSIYSWVPPVTSVPLIGHLFSAGCTSAANSWTFSTGNTLPNNTKNNGFYFNQYAFIPSTSIYPWVEFNAKANKQLDTNDNVACNSFVASAAIRRIVSGGVLRDYKIQYAESTPVCITMTQQNQKPPCDSIEKSNLDFDSCYYCVAIANTNPAGINSMNVSLTGATITSISSTVCPLTLSGLGTSNATVNFYPTCTQNTLYICLKAAVIPGNTSGNIIVNWMTTHPADPAQKPDSCWFRSEYACKGIDTVPNTETPCACDSLLIEPDIDTQTSSVGHKYTIFNNYLPASDICSVKVSVSPYPSSGWCLPRGGDPVVNGGSVPSSSHWDVPYETFYPGITGVNSLSFFYDFLWSCPGPLVVTLKVMHCNGDSCVYHDTLNLSAPKPVNGLVVFEAIPDSLKVFRIKLKGNAKQKEPVKYITIDLPEALGSLMAISGRGFWWGDGDADLINSQMNQNHAFFTLRNPIMLKTDEISKEVLTVLWKKVNGTSMKPNIKVILFNANGEPLAYDSTDVTTSIDVGAITKGFEGNEFELLKSVPNPAQDYVSLSYIIGSQADIKLALYDVLGNEIMLFNEGFKAQGIHLLNVNTSGLVNGVYYVKLLSPTRSTSLQLLITK